MAQEAGPACVAAGNCRFTRCQREAGQYRCCMVPAGQQRRPFKRFLAVLRRAVRREPEQDGGFGGVRRDHIGLCAQPAHLCAERGGCAVIEPPVIAHHRVNDEQAAAQPGGSGSYNFQLLRGGQEARIYRVEPDAERFILVQGGAHSAGQVGAVPAGEPQMAGIDGGRHGDALVAHRAQGRDNRHE